MPVFRYEQTQIGPVGVIVYDDIAYLSRKPSLKSHNITEEQAQLGVDKLKEIFPL